MKRAQVPTDPVLKRRVGGGPAIYLGMGGLYTAYQVNQGGNAELIGVLLLVGASLAAAGTGLFAIVRPVRAVGWLVQVVLVVLIVAFAALNFLWSRPDFS